MVWDILEIEETKDIKKITQAYRKKLVHTNPEDKPEEFKKLREAYEQALDYARNNKQEKSQIEIWKEKLTTLYCDFSRRIQVKEWETFLRDEICLSFDKKMLVEELLLKFFMDFYRIPHSVWVYLNAQFSFMEHIDELYEKYPKEFIDYVVISGIRFEDALPFEYFAPGQDGSVVDEYIQLYMEANRESYEVAMGLVERMDSLSESHPYGSVLKANLEMEQDPKTSLQILEQLHIQYETDEYIANQLANAYLFQGQNENCETLCKEILEHSENQRVKWILANCLGNQKRYKEAIEYIHELMNTSGGDQSLLYELNQKRMEWNVFLIEKYEAILEEDYDNHQNRVDLTWAYLQNDFIDKAYELSKTLDLKLMEPFDYYNLMSNIHIAKEKYEEAIPFIDSLLTVLENMEDDGTKKTKKRLRRYPEILNRKGFCLLQLNRDEEGMKVYDQALRVSNGDPDILTRVCQIAMSKQKYEQAQDYAKRLIDVNPQAYHGYLLLAFALFYQHYDQEAFQYCNQSIDMYSGDLEAYILKVRILARNQGYQGAHEILSFLESNGLENDVQILFCKGLLKEYEEEDEKGALVYYQKAAKQIKTVGMYNFAAEMYYRMLWIQGSLLNVNKDKDYKVLLSLANKGLKENERHYGLKDYKAWLLLRRNKYKQALKIYKDLETYPNHTADVETQIGYIYYQNLEEHAQDSLDYYLKSIEEEDTGNKRFYAGMCYVYLGQLEEAKNQFLILQQMNPDGLDSYFRLSGIYEATNQLDLALENINKTIEIISQREGDQSRYYRCKARILRRMKRVEEAVEVMRFIQTTYQDPLARKRIVEIYCQAGEFELAKREIEKWKEEDRETYDAEPEIRMYIVLNDIKKANEVFDTYKNEMDIYQFLSLQKTIHQINVDLEKECDVLHRQEELYRQEYQGDPAHIYMNLAQCYHRMNEPKKQKMYARKALTLINKSLKQHSLDHTLHYGRKSKMLALLNKEKEARECLQKAKTSPLCDFCPYSACKDADIYEVNVEEFLGNTQKAKELAKEYLKKWPDEDDFMVEIEQIRKKEEA